MNKYENLPSFLARRFKKTSSSQKIRGWPIWLPTPGNVIFTLVAVSILVASQTVWAQTLHNNSLADLPPSATTINYQGRLANNSNGAPISGEHEMSFALYDAPTNGNLIWGPERHTTVPVEEGLFSIGLGSQTNGGIPMSTWNGDCYLEITVEEEILSPRELIRSVPVAGMALTVPDGSITQEQSSFAPVVYHRARNSESSESVDKPIIWSGWFYGSSDGFEILDLSDIFSQVDAVMVTRTRTSGGTSSQVTFMVTDAAGTGKPIPSEIKIWAQNLNGDLANWIQAYVVVIGK